MRVAAALWAAWLLKLGVVTAAALYPLRGQLWRLARLCDALELYSLANSNLDVWVLTLAHTTVVAALLSRVVAPARRFSGLLVPPPYGKVRQRLPGHSGWAAERLWQQVCGLLLLRWRRNSPARFPSRC